MAPFKALYGRRCRTSLNWIEPGETIFGPDLVTKTEEIVRHIQSNLKAAKAHQESYANKQRRPLEFEADDHVYLHVVHARCEEVWDQRQASTSLHRSVSLLV
jgi:hypothetical protein